MYARWVIIIEKLVAYASIINLKFKGWFIIIKRKKNTFELIYW